MQPILRPRRAALLVFVLGAACGAPRSPVPEPTPAPRSAPPPTSPTTTSPAPSPSSAPATSTEPPPSPDALPCAADADCIVGTPRDCCSAFCPCDARPWSRARWDAYQRWCATIDCEVLEEPACLPDQPSFEARCRDGACTLVRTP